jgi:hypothetical protein
MFKKIEKLAACEMQSVIRFLNARNMKLADIHHKLCEVWRTCHECFNGKEMGETLQ